MSAGTRGLVDGQCLDIAEVCPLQGQFNVALAQRQHPVGGLPDDACDSGERHLLRQHQHERLEQQREAGQAAGKLGLDQAHRAVGQLHPRGADLQVALVLEEVQVPIRLGDGVVRGMSSLVARDCEAAAGDEIDEHRQPPGPFVKRHRLDGPRCADPQCCLEELVVHVAPLA